MTIFKIFAKSAKIFFFKIFYFLMNFRTSFTSYWENRTVFRPKKCIFCETNFAGEEKIQKKLIFAIFFFQMPKKASEKLKCNDFFYFYSILPPKKWGKTIKKYSYFSRNWDSGSFNMRAFVKIRDFIIPRGKISKGYNLANIWRIKSMDTIFRAETPDSFIWNYQSYILRPF